jgi:hypothetical protein
MRSAISPRLAISSFSMVIVSSITTSGWSNSTGWAFSTRICVTVPPLGAMIGFITFIASMISSVSPSFTVSPTLIKAAASGSKAQIDRADHRRFDRAGMIRRRRCRSRRSGCGRCRNRGRRCCKLHRSRRRLKRARQRGSCDRLSSTSISLSPVSFQQLGQLAHQRALHQPAWTLPFHVMRPSDLVNGCALSETSPPRPAQRS